jgi:hypothetical protein
MYRKIQSKIIASILTLVLMFSAIEYFATEGQQYIKSSKVQQLNEYNPLSNVADARGKRKQGGEMKNKARKSSKWKGKSNPRSNNVKKHTPSKKHKGGKKTKGSNKKKR